jgi:DNA-binding HxlR family transcriptional regulator
MTSSLASHSAADKMQACPVMTTVGVLTGKWKPRALWHLRLGPSGFGELQRATGASERMLSKSLRELQADGIVTRSESHAGKVRLSRYAYTAYGETLIPVLNLLGAWGAVHQRQ